LKWFCVFEILGKESRVIPYLLSNSKQLGFSFWNTFGIIFNNLFTKSSQIIAVADTFTMESLISLPLEAEILDRISILRFSEQFVRAN